MEKAKSYSINFKNTNVYPAPLSNRSEKNIKVYPSDFMHGLLSAHVADETGIIAGKCLLIENSKISFKIESNIYKEFLNKKTLNINNLIDEWFIEKIIENEETGYCGIVYKNILTNNIVLAHRSTNFKLGLGSNLFKQSGIQTDYESIMLGILVPHMAFAHKATKIAVEIAKNLNYTLSFTGHSLGAFLAEMSIYYCSYELNHKFVKAIVFDGPGSWDLMNLLDNNKIKNIINMIKLEELDIVSYITAPNLVNCCNSRLGKVFTIFPKLEKDFGIYSQIIKNFGKKYDSALCSTFYGHDLVNILPYFDVETGRPSEFELVLRWPKISHKEFGKKRNTNSITLSIINKIFSSESAEIIVGFFNLFIREDKVLSTIESIVLVLQDFILGKIQLNEFWNVHKLINIENDFHKPKDLDPKEEFGLIYSLNYNIKPYNLYESTLNDKTDEIDRFLIFTKKNEESLKEFMLTIKMLIPFWEYYNYYEGTNEIKIFEQYKKVICVQDLRDYMRFLLLKKPDILKKLTASEKEVLNANKTDNQIIINSLKNNYKTLLNIMDKEKSRYQNEITYLNLLKSEEEKIQNFIDESFDNLIYKFQIHLFGRTNAGKSTLGSKLLINDDKIKIFPSNAVAETFVPTEISVNEEIKIADIQINYNTGEKSNYETENLEDLIKIINENISKKSSINNSPKIIEEAIINCPQSFFPKIKPGTKIVDTPGFSENEKMKKFNLSQLAKEKNRSVIVFLIPLEMGGSLMQENVDILSAYKTNETDLSSNIIFVLTKFKNFKNSCEDDNNDCSTEELLEYINKSIQEAFVLPLKNQYPSAKIVIYDIGKEMEKIYYDKDSLLIKMEESKDQNNLNQLNIKQETLKFLNEYINEQLLNNEYLYMDFLKQEALKSVNRVMQFMINFHSEEKNVKENKEKIEDQLTKYIKELKGKSLAEFKSEIFNEKILKKFIDTNITEKNLEFKEKCINLVESEVQSTIENYLTKISYSLEEVFYEHLFFYVMRDLPSDQNTVKSKVIKIREEIIDFLKNEKIKDSKVGFFKGIKKFFTRIIPNLFRSELSKFKLNLYDTYSTDYWLNGKEIVQFYEHLLKELPRFVNLIGMQYNKKKYSGKSNDLYKQCEHLIESINKSY